MSKEDVVSFDSYNLKTVKRGHAMTILSGKADNEHIPIVFIKREAARKDDSGYPAYGIDRYAYNQGENGQFAFSILENIEPSIVARGGGGSRSEKWKLYQEKVGALCAIDYKGVKNEMAEMDKLIIQRHGCFTKRR